MTKEELTLSPQSMVYFIMEASLKTDANSLLIDIYVSEASHRVNLDILKATTPKKSVNHYLNPIQLQEKA